MSHTGLQVVEVASHLTPVPGGVGPMTVAMLMYNTVQVANFDFFKDVCLLVNSPTLIYTKIFCLFQGAVRAHEAR